MSDLVRYEVRNRKAYLTLNRPDRLNAITAGMARLLTELVDRANEDPEVHVVVLQGAGRAFCGGYDLKQYAEQGDLTQPPVWDSPEGRWFQEFAAQHGFPAAVRWRDSGRPIPDGGGPVPTTAELDEE